jgi:23S rRNA (cytidine1920-2'-O)/16S rRNA (cytidine1409-2'-O)-methyltransferase
VSDPEIHDRVCSEIGAALVAAGCTVNGWTPSPITGADGNREFLVWATTGVTDGSAAIGDPGEVGAVDG